MIVLITGASHTGKTLLAQKLLERYQYPYLSIDLLKMGLIRSKNTDLTPEDDDGLMDYLWRIIREIIKTAIENKQNLVVEGCYIPHSWNKDFSEEYLLPCTRNHRRSIFLPVLLPPDAAEKRTKPGSSWPYSVRNNSRDGCRRPRCTH